jgi:hypothetical protein
VVFKVVNIFTILNICYNRKSMNKIHKYLFLTIITVFVFPLFSLGQTFFTGTNGLEIAINPENPEPNETVTITINSNLYDLDRSKITWYVDGKVTKTDMGLKKFSTNAGNNGKKTTIKVAIETFSGETKEIEAYFIPTFVDLIYEAVSYTPPFYKGKTLNPNQGVIVVNAIPEFVTPNGERISNNNLIYSWKKDRKTFTDSSGLGKNTFIYNGTVPIKEALIEVTVSSLDNEIYASKMIIINHDTPKIVFYEDNPIYGIMFNRAIKTGVRMITDEFKVRAIPYFTTVGYTNSPDLDFKWSLNNSSISNLTDEDKNVMIFRQESEGSGSATVGLKVENNSRIFQFTENNFSLNFEK